MRFWLCLLLAAPCAAQTVPAVRVAVLPFVDKAGFQGDWDLSLDVPRLLVRYLEREPGLHHTTTAARWRSRRSSRFAQLHSRIYHHISNASLTQT